MFIGLLVLMLSKPGDPMVFGVVKEYPSYNECIRALYTMEGNKDLGCIEVKVQPPQKPPKES